MSKYEELKDEE